MSTPEEDALSWAGDNDRLTTGSPVSPRTDARGASVVGPGKKSRKTSALPDGSPARSGLSSAALIGFGIFGGIYLLFTVAWLITALRNPTEIADVLGNAMFQFGLWLAVASPAIWFGAVLFLAKEKNMATRMLFLLLGAVILIPWPYISWAG